MTALNYKVDLLLIEDEEFDVRRVENTLYPVRDRVVIRDVVSTGPAALDLLEKNPDAYQVVIMDFQIAGGLTGERLIQKIKHISPEVQIIIITKMTINLTDFEFANKLMDAGAMWYCTKYPGDIEEYIYQPTDFILSIFNAAEKYRMEKQQRTTTKRLEQNVRSILDRRKIIGHSPATEALRRQVDKLASSEGAVLIHGDSGTGKELIALNIHYRSQRKFEKFVPINCGSIPDQLLESELFGYRKGAFTGATGDKAGLLEIAHKGTAFLDEIGELPLSAQVKLLRFLQEGEIDTIGRTRKKRVDVRIIAATNKNIEEEVRRGRFREDLYYRLNVFPVLVQPLRERIEDVRDLIEYYLDKFSREMSVEKPQLEPGAWQALEHHPWPGNVRELQNVIQRLLLMAESPVDASAVEAALGMSRSRAASATALSWDPRHLKSWKEMETQFRREYFDFARRHSRSDAEAARKLGLAPPNFHRMCKELGLK